ncbi:NAD(P)H-dependent oxidoreductase [Nocardia sp. NPDC052566]|uniref:NAD(P)H-dependent oxidoreductase n=1 Tax=Nocardia sp. NPDC052566 TaxID=3364330 RepID=UPI0037CA99F8
MTRIAIILGSTRPNRKGPQIAQWVLDSAAQRGDAEFELIDLRDHPLPHLDEPTPPMFGPSADERVRAWAERIAPFDGFVFVTPEYNGGAPGVLKNAIDHLFTEWTDKAVGFVSYGVSGGVRSVVQLRTVCGTLGMADVGYQVAISLLTDFENHATFIPRDHHAAALGKTLDQLIAWSTALAPLRRGAETTLESEEAALRGQIEKVVEGLRAKDLEAVRRLYTTDVVSFDVEPPLQHVGAAAKLENWANVFLFFESVTYEIRDLTFTIGDDVAFGHAFARLSGTLKNGAATSGMWVRVTYGMRKIHGTWLIAHDQVSVPLDITSGSGVVDLEPEPVLTAGR